MRERESFLTALKWSFGLWLGMLFFLAFLMVPALLYVLRGEEEWYWMLGFFITIPLCTAGINYFLEIDNSHGNH